jgi:DNA polymerase IV
MSSARVILHVDMDAFYASVEQRDDPSLKGKPVLVGGTSGRGVVCAASYEARQFGCRSAMPMTAAMRLCPHAKVVKPRFYKYREASDRVHEVLQSITPMIEPLSLDEAFLDCTGSTRLFGDGVAIANRIRQRVRESTQLTCSVGVAYNKFLAKLASDLKKPDGLAVVTPETIRTILDPLPVTRIWGVGPKLNQTLLRFNIKTIGDLTRYDHDWFKQHLGHHGPRLLELALGQDDRPVVNDHQAKSIGHEETFDHNIASVDHLRTILLEQIEQVATRLRKHQLLAKTVSLKIRDGEFNTITRQATLDVPSDLTIDLWHAAEKLLAQWAGEKLVPLRLMGVSLSQLSSTGQIALFDQQATEKARKVDEVVDQIRNKFGQDKIGRKV